MVYFYMQALQEEKAAYDRSGTRNVYLNVAVNTIKRLRTEQPREPGASSDLSDTETDTLQLNSPVTSPTSPLKSPPHRQRIATSHLAQIGGAKAAKTSFTLNRSKGSYLKVPDKFYGKI